MRKQACNLIIHGRVKEINMGEFESKAAAKRYMDAVSNICKQPYSLKPIKS